MAVADRADQRPIFGGRHDHAAGALDRLGKEGGDGVGALEGDFVFQGLGTELGQALGVALAERIAVRPWRGNVIAPRQRS